MRLTPQEEYGLRCLLVVCREAPLDSVSPVSIERIAESEGMGYEHAAKILRLLRRGDLVTSTRGVNGGYRLTRSPEQITVWQTLVTLDKPLIDGGFCETFSGRMQSCTHASSSCNLKSLWGWVGNALEEGLSRVTLADLAAGRQPNDILREAP